MLGDDGYGSEDEDLSSSDSRDGSYDSEDDQSYERMEKKIFGKYGSTGKKQREYGVPINS